MKRILIVLTGILFFNNIFAQTSKNITSTLQTVTVYSTAAELSHSAKTALPAGTSEIVIGNLSNSVDVNSIQVGCTNDVTIMSVQYRQEYREVAPKTPELIRLETDLQNAKNEYNKTTNQISTYTDAKSILDANKKVSGDNTGLSVAELQKMVDYYIVKTQDLKTQINSLTEKQTMQNEEVQKIQNQINALTTKNVSSKGELVLQVLSNAATSATFNISYVTYTAAWTPMYDLKTNSTNSPLKIIYKADVVQSTGLDWKNVHLTISTANPSQTGTAPVLSTWFLNYYMPVYGNNYNQQYKNSIQSYAPVAAPGYDDAKAKLEQSTVNNYTTVSETALNATFDIDLPYDIASDGKAHSVAMKDYEVPAQYKYYSAPRKDKDAFLIAEISDWEKLNLVPGNANIIFDGTYVGKSFIDPNTTQDTLNISLGRDKKIVVKREKLVDFCSAKLIGTKKLHTVTYEIKIKNTRKESIQLLLKDQYPISQDKDIEVDLLESSDASINTETGILTWKVNIGAGETKKVKISYSVKFPKDKPVGNLF